jgi:hypothetical protein
LSITAEQPIADLHIRIDGSTLELTASRATPNLRLQGAVVSSIRSIRLNGAGRACAQSHRADAIEVPVEWWPTGERVADEREAPCVA